MFPHRLATSWQHLIFKGRQEGGTANMRQWLPWGRGWGGGCWGQGSVGGEPLWGTWALVAKFSHWTGRTYSHAPHAAEHLRKWPSFFPISHPYGARVCTHTGSAVGPSNSSPQTAGSASPPLTSERVT